jgi:2-oxoglutarate dehydrogenase complex dehydrogenase (E1) component-like enzyme
MLRASKILNLVQQQSLLSRQLISIIKTNSNNYQYQADIYTNKFENTKLTKELKSDLLKLNQHRNKHPNLYRFVKSYQQYGYKKSQLDPLKANNELDNLAELEPEFYGLSRDENKHPVEGLLNLNENASMTINEIENYLKKIYSQHMTIEFEFLQNEEEKLWIAR